MAGSCCQPGAPLHVSQRNHRVLCRVLLADHVSRNRLEPTLRAGAPPARPLTREPRTLGPRPPLPLGPQLGTAFRRGASGPIDHLGWARMMGRFDRAYFPK
jgi:hypothetical protein